MAQDASLVAASDQQVLVHPFKAVHGAKGLLATEGAYTLA